LRSAPSDPERGGRVFPDPRPSGMRRGGAHKKTSPTGRVFYCLFFKGTNARFSDSLFSVPEIFVEGLDLGSSACSLRYRYKLYRPTRMIKPGKQSSRRVKDDQHLSSFCLYCNPLAPEVCKADVKIFLIFCNFPFFPSGETRPCSGTSAAGAGEMIFRSSP